MSTPADPRLPKDDLTGTGAAGTPGRPRRVVVAEDETLIRMDLTEMLAEEGFEVVGQAADGDQAIAMATRLRPDLVLMDILLPHTDGITAAAALTANRIGPVLMLTAFSDPATLVHRARDAGAMAYVRKPFSKANLLPAIEMSIARYAETAALRQQVAEIADRLQFRKVIDRAKGLLMAHRQMTEPEAFRWLQRAAMDHRTSMVNVASVVIDDLAHPTRGAPHHRNATSLSGGRSPGHGTRRRGG